MANADSCQCRSGVCLPASNHVLVALVDGLAREARITPHDAFRFYCLFADLDPAALD